LGKNAVARNLDLRAHTATSSPELQSRQSALNCRRTDSQEVNVLMYEEAVAAKYTAFFWRSPQKNGRRQEEQQPHVLQAILGTIVQNK
jgi:hypothetical protein